MNATPGRHWDNPAQDCPKWCCGEHMNQSHPDDAIHSSCLDPLPVIVRTKAASATRWDQTDLWSQDAPFPRDDWAGRGKGANQPPGVSDLAYSWSGGAQSQGGSGIFVDEATYFDVVRMQWVAGGDEWLFVGDGTSSWLVTVESARRIFRAMGRILWT